MTDTTELNTIEEKTLETRSIDLMIFRILVVTAILGMGIFIFERTEIVFPHSLIPLYGLIIASYILTLLFWIISKTNVPSKTLLYIQLFTDILIETGFVYYTGGILSQFSVLYGLSILAGSFFFHLKGGIVISTFASVSYAVLVTLEQTGQIPRIFLTEFITEDRPLISNSYVFLKVYLHICFFYLLAFLSGFLAERAKKRREEAMEAKKELKKIRVNTDDILQNMNSGLITIDYNGKIVSFNKAAKQILDFTDPIEEIEGNHFSEILTDRVKPLSQILRQILDTCHSMDYTELSIDQMDNTTIPIGVKTSILRDENENPRGVIALFDDLTEKKKMEERIRRSDRLAAIGKLSAGIAHEIRNPLSSLTGSIQYLKDELELDGANERLFNVVLKESSRLDKLIENFLYFARLKQADISEFKLRNIVDEVIMLIKNNPQENNKDIRFYTDIEENFTIQGSEEQIKQMLLNLSLNALQAMNSEGDLKFIGYEESEKNVIIVEDTGSGISDNLKKQIYEPFFTTRKTGTGLGLAVVLKIIENHKGDIFLDSEVDVGTKFTIKLPKDLINEK